jgi:hypothetical protein
MLARRRAQEKHMMIDRPHPKIASLPEEKAPFGFNSAAKKTQNSGYAFLLLQGRTGQSMSLL